ncbi:hypothetical protein E2C01_027546 [Portunus trituberculatus]|uniref:Uncharacterized protein n=1 Tax=Portunus trituberculatus TaxID=210409 RepID=A0A5B7EL53_PORTR|nr:hypothetical protein [Portunus trituberculatus]
MVPHRMETAPDGHRTKRDKNTTHFSLSSAWQLLFVLWAGEGLVLAPRTRPSQLREISLCHGSVYTTPSLCLPVFCLTNFSHDVD